jgi:1-phosphofructokinase family hexose kinase
MNPRSVIATVTPNPSLDLRLGVREGRGTIRVTGAGWRAGGKGINVSRALRRLGVGTLAFGLAGGRTGTKLAKRLTEEKIPHKFIRIAGETRINTTITDRRAGSEVHLRASGPRVAARELDRLTRALLAFPESPSFWVLSGSLPPGAPADYYRRLIRRLGSRRCVLDADGEALRLGVEAGPFLVKPNAEEFQRLTGERAGSDAGIRRGARQLLRQGVSIIVVTLGARGAAAVSRDEFIRVRPSRAKITTAVGAGDAALAGILAALQKGASLRAALRSGMAAVVD